MTTPNDYIKDALEDLGYLGAEQPLESTDSAKAFGILNDMLAEWGDTGILPGARPVDSLTDVVRAPRAVDAAIKANLAGRCSPSFRRPITPELAAVIKGTSEALLRLTSKIGDVSYPDTLPIGSGNECFDYDRYFVIEEINF